MLCRFFLPLAVWKLTCKTSPWTSRSLKANKDSNEEVFRKSFFQRIMSSFQAAGFSFPTPGCRSFTCSRAWRMFSLPQCFERLAAPSLPPISQIFHLHTSLLSLAISLLSRELRLFVSVASRCVFSCCFNDNSVSRAFHMLSRKTKKRTNDENVCLSFDLCEKWSVSYQSDEMECEFDWMDVCGRENVTKCCDISIIHWTFDGCLMEGLGSWSGNGREMKVLRMLGWN
jgi:hypothetical protein